MSCPQCGGTLATYTLGGEEASVCEDCGYVGIAAEHRGDPRTAESWNDALRRFYRAHGHEEEPSVELRPPLSRPSAGSTDEGESWDDALRRFYARQTVDDEATDDEATDDVAAEDAETDSEGDAEADADAGTDADAADATDESEGVEADTRGR